MPTTVLITGASSGIGYEFAKVCAEHKYDLVLVARRKVQLEKIKEDFEHAFEIAVTVLPFDLANPSAPDEIFNFLNRKGITVDILFNNAGFGDFGPFADADWKKLSDMIQVNIAAVTYLTKLFLPGMIKRRQGKILNIASTAAFGPGPLMAVYYATKGFVLSFTEALAKELQGTGVTCTVLCPGPTATGFQALAGSKQSRLVSGKKLPTARQVAEFGFDAIFKGKVVAIPGVINSLLVQLPRFLPRKTVTDLVYKIQESKK